jgi:hypothetical protein
MLPAEAVISEEAVGAMVDASSGFLALICSEAIELSKKAPASSNKKRIMLLPQHAIDALKLLGYAFCCF